MSAETEPGVSIERGKRYAEGKERLENWKAKKRRFVLVDGFIKIQEGEQIEGNSYIRDTMSPETRKSLKLFLQSDASRTVKDDSLAHREPMNYWDNIIVDEAHEDQSAVEYPWGMKDQYGLYFPQQYVQYGGLSEDANNINSHQSHGEMDQGFFWTIHLFIGLGVALVVLCIFCLGICSCVACVCVAIFKSGGRAARTGSDIVESHINQAARTGSARVGSRINHAVNESMDQLSRAHVGSRINQAVNQGIDQAVNHGIDKLMSGVAAYDIDEGDEEIQLIQENVEERKSDIDDDQKQEKQDELEQRD